MSLKSITQSGLRGRPGAWAALAAAGLLWAPGEAAAYIGPGAGFALGGSVLFALAGVALAAGALLLWPARALLRLARGGARRRKAAARRVVVLGLDGLDPELAARWMDQGRLPNLARLREQGGFRPLATTLPSISPVAWSGFATGVDASRHNIFDFLERDPATHLPVLSSTRLRTAGRELRLGPWRLRRPRARYELMRRSKAFWRVLAEHGVPCTVLRVPITFPPEKFAGKMLSAMCVPDLRGTQGTFACYSSAPATGGETTGGLRLPLRADGEPGLYRGEVPGPDGPDGKPLTLPLAVRVDAAAQRAEFELDGQRFTLGPGQDSPWIRLAFRLGRRARVRGICRVRVLSLAEPVSFYMTPLHIDPEHPALPISHPPHYAVTLAKLLGPYATLGLAEDTWALNERVIDEQAFLDQVYAIHAEREAQFFHALDRQPGGLVAAVFDATDRIQHMFFRHLDPGHPANAGRDGARHGDAIADLYRRADDLVGRTLARLGPRDALLVISDHGFKTFQRGVDLNAWFRRHGYLRLRGDPDGGPLPPPPGGRAEPEQIDWSRTRAYATGLAGCYLNLRGRERDGAVAPAEAPALAGELRERLRALRDDERGQPAVSEVWDAREVYRGPYGENAPDLIIGWQPGYRTGWDAAVGRVGAAVFADNTRAWSGDHCIDPRLVPGVLFATRPPRRDDPALTDLAPTILRLLGVAPPPYMNGRDIFEEAAP